MNSKNQKIEEIFEQAVKLLRDGKTPKQVLDLWPEAETELEDLLKLTNILKEQKEFFEPKQELLKTILNQLEKIDVAEKELSPYLIKNKGRFSIINNLLNQIHNLMTLRWKIAFSLIVIVVGLGLYYQFGLEKPQYVIGLDNQKILLSEPSADVNKMAEALNQEASIEQSLTAEENALLIDIDSSMMSDFGQSYDENEL